MAHTKQTATSPFQIEPVAYSMAPDQVERPGIVPNMRAVYQDALAVTGSTVGNTFELELTLPLAKNLCWYFDSWLMDITDEDPCEIANGQVFVTIGKPNNALQVGKPLAVGSLIQVDQSNWHTSVAPGCLLDKVTFDYTLTHLQRLGMFGVDGGASDVLIGLSGAATTDIFGFTLNYQITMLGFTIPQTLDAQMYTRVPVSN